MAKLIFLTLDTGHWTLKFILELEVCHMFGWLYSCMAVRMYIWLYGSMAVWLYGCMAV